MQNDRASLGSRKGNVLDKQDRFKSERKTVRLNLLNDRNVIDVCCLLGILTFFLWPGHTRWLVITYADTRDTEDRLDEYI